MISNLRSSVLFETNFKLLFLFICLLYILSLVLIEYILLPDYLFYSYFDDQFSQERITSIIEQNHRWSWLSYILIPIFSVIKFSLVAICLLVGSILGGYIVPFKKLFQMAIISETVFLLMPFVKILWFGIINKDYTLLELYSFTPLSIINLVHVDSIEPYLLYPLQILNFFEVAYCCVLASLLKDILNKDFRGSLGFVASTYGVGLLLWVILVMFLTVSLT